MPIESPKQFSHHLELLKTLMLIYLLNNAECRSEIIRNIVKCIDPFTVAPLQTYFRPLRGASP